MRRARRQRFRLRLQSNERSVQDEGNPVGAIYSEERLPDGSPTTSKYNSADPNKGNDHTFFVQHNRDVFAD